MNKLFILYLKTIRNIYRIFYDKTKTVSDYDIIFDAQESSDLLYNAITAPEPCMIARFGGFELNVVANYLSIKEKTHSWTKFIKGEVYEWWWNQILLEHFRDNAGFFPLDDDYVCRFCELMISDSQQLDLLGSWLDNEYLLIGYPSRVKRVRLLHMEPYWAECPWTRALRGKKILVIHPFVKLIEKQYREHRTQLFKNPDVLPEFDLQTIQAVQSIGGKGGEFENWFDALQYMKDEIDKRDFDIALIGCGAYGFSIAAHVKRRGKKAVHMGGALQLLFGIKGKRWEDPNYGFGTLGKKGRYLELFNNYWIRPGVDAKPVDAEKVEGACYW